MKQNRLEVIRVTKKLRYSITRNFVTLFVTFPFLKWEGYKRPTLEFGVSHGFSSKEEVCSSKEASSKKAPGVQAPFCPKGEALRRLFSRSRGFVQR